MIVELTSKLRSICFPQSVTSIDEQVSSTIVIFLFLASLGASPFFTVIEPTSPTTVTTPKTSFKLKKNQMVTNHFILVAGLDIWNRYKAVILEWDHYL